MRANRPIVILKLIGNERAALPRKERSRVRAAVHRFCTIAESGADVAPLAAELPRVRGLAYKVKRFHPVEGAKLVAQLDQAAKLIRALQSV